MFITGIDEFDRLALDQKWLVLSRIPGTVANIELWRQIATAYLLEARKILPFLDSFYAFQAVTASVAHSENKVDQEQEALLAPPVVNELVKSLSEQSTADKLLPHLVEINNRLSVLVADYKQAIQEDLNTNKELSDLLASSAPSERYATHESLAELTDPALADSAIVLDSPLLPDYLKHSGPKLKPVLSLRSSDDHEPLLDSVTEFRQKLLPEEHYAGLSVDAQRVVDATFFQTAVGLDSRSMLANALQRPDMFKRQIELMLSSASALAQLQNTIHLGVHTLGGSQQLFKAKGHLDVYTTSQSILASEQFMQNNHLYLLYIQRVRPELVLAPEAHKAQTLAQSSAPKLTIRGG